MSDTVIDLIRHGEPVGGRRYRGHIDDPLSERGWQQMWSLPMRREFDTSSEIHTIDVERRGQ